MTAAVRVPIPRELRVVVLASGPCVYCGAPATTVDHDIPVIRGGANGRDNLVPACWTCNMAKGSMTGLEFLAVLSKRAIRPPIELISAAQLIARIRAHGNEALRVILTALREHEGMTYRRIHAETGIHFATAQRFVEGKR